MSKFKLAPGEIDDLAVGFTSVMDDGDSLTTPIEVTVHETEGAQAEATGFTASSEQVNTGTITDSRGGTHAVGFAIEFRLTLAADAAAGSYSVRVEAPTTNGQNKVALIPLEVGGPEDPAP